MSEFADTSIGLEKFVRTPFSMTLPAVGQHVQALEAPLSSSLGTMELEDTAGGTRLRFTEHTAFLDGNESQAERTSSATT